MLADLVRAQDDAVAGAEEAIELVFRRLQLPHEPVWVAAGAHGQVAERYRRQTEVVFGVGRARCDLGCLLEAEEIAETGIQVFGPDGVVAKFVTSAMGPLVVRRGDVLAARTWADIGITLAPQAVASFPNWIAPLSANGVAASNGPQTVFQLQALPAPGTTEYTVEIDGQQLRYRNTPPVWTNMVHPGPQGAPGAKISAVTFDGRTVELFNEPGQFGLQRLIESAARTRKGERWFELRWNVGGVALAVELKIVSDATSNGNGSGSPQGKGFAGLRLPDAIVGRALVAPGTPAVATLAGGTP